MSLSVYLDPPACPHCGLAPEGFSANITHNLVAMAKEAGIYGIVWRPEENGVLSARQLIVPLRDAIATMKADTERFKRHDAPNGWGTYDAFIPWLERYLEACRRMPDADVTVSR